MNTEVLSVKNIKKSFKNGEDRSEVLRGVSFSVFDGEFISISGPSGCGKSTLLNLMGLLDTPDSGEYFVDGLLVTDMSASQRAKIRGNRIGFVFQSFNLIDEMNILENVALPLKYRGDSLSSRHARALDCLEKVGLADKAHLFPNQVSGGQQQRVSIARALAGDSGIMLVDEPTGNLDSKNGDAIMQLILDLNRQGTTIVLVTHDPRYANMASRTIHLKDGLVITPSEEAQEPSEAA
ncbi:ABC transporter ATP-binding protein [Pseudoalteromonas xiamenensis]